MVRVIIFSCFAITISSCGVEVGPSGNINPELGSTQMGQCALIDSNSLDFSTMNKILFEFAAENGMKFLDEREHGSYGSYLQIDRPYSIVSHSYFGQRTPPEHMVIFFKGENDPAANSIETRLFDKLKRVTQLKSCGQYTSAITPGWRLQDK